MMQEKRQVELKVGLFLNLGIALVTIAALLLGASQNFTTKKNTYKIVIDNAQGLATGAKVLIGGIQAGSVESLDLTKDDRRVKIRVKVLKKFEDAIRVDTQAELTTEGLLGDKIVSLNAGDPEKPIIPEGSVIPNREGTDFTRVVSKGDVFLTNLNRLTLNLNKIVDGFTQGRRGEELAEGIAETAKNLATLTRNLNAPDGEMRKLTSVLTKLNSVLAKVDDGQGSIGALVNDPELYDDAKKLVGESNSNRIVRNLVHKTIKDADLKEADKDASKQDQG
jgi:phospholipid/cholesterol/gamma-HCH transport system substrate-binding protein